jgi:hypothetical protein
MPSTRFTRRDVLQLTGIAPLASLSPMTLSQTSSAAHQETPEGRLEIIAFLKRFL